MTFGKYNVDYEQRIYNPERMRKYRLNRAHTMLKKHGLGAMIVYDFDTFRYLGYYTWHNYMRRRPGARYLLLIRDNGFPYCPAADPSGAEAQLTPWLKDKMVLRGGMGVQSGLSFEKEYVAKRWAGQAEEIKGLLKQHKVADLPVGIDVHFGLHTVRACDKAGIELVDGNPAMAEARMIKNEDEIECCRTAGSIVESAHWEICKALRPGLTEWQINGVAAKALFDLGAEELEGPSFIACSGPRFGHYGVMTGTDRVIRPGELYVTDINGVSFQGYRTCFYRTYCVGDKPTEKQKDLYKACYEIQTSMEKSIKPNNTYHDYVKAVLEKGKGKWPGNFEFQGRKWGPTWPEAGRYFTPNGHQLGLASGDPGPTVGIRSGSAVGVVTLPPNYTIQPGMVLAIEVAARDWDGKQWSYDGVKLENVGVVTDTEFEILYRFPIKDLIACGLPGVY